MTQLDRCSRVGNSSLISEESLDSRYMRIRNASVALCESLAIEDMCIQSMPDVSPLRWHLAHTTWFFETFILRHQPGYRPYNEAYLYLFNSYYNALGEQFPRAQRGLLSRPTVAEVVEYRRAVDTRMQHLLSAEKRSSSNRDVDLKAILELGLQHEQQHQELMLTDIKHALSSNPMYPTFRKDRLVTGPGIDLKWVDFSAVLTEIGCSDQGFSYDNERPRHRVYLAPFRLANRLVTNGEYLAFVEGGGYHEAPHWLSDGWNWLSENKIEAPLYWVKRQGHWFEFTLNGLQPLNPALPVTHMSYYEADAFAHWSGARLPTEFEWEHAATVSGASARPSEGADHRLKEHLAIHPVPATESETAKHEPPCLTQMMNEVWQWTRSAYSPYPGFHVSAGALGEYNGKFMCNQMVLRGGSCASPSHHLRATYRNFFPPNARWQFTGIRLARDSL